MQEEGLLREGSLFIDGTKIEADANKYTFVWKKAIEKYHAKLKIDALNLYEDLVQEKVTKAITEEEAMTSKMMAKEIETEIEQINQEIKEEPPVIPGGSPKKQRRRRLKKHLHKLNKDYVLRAKKYEKAKQILGERNSFSKTDHDATFMHMKEDHMRNGQLKPGYNVQAATSNQYIIDFALYHNPTDFRTLEPFLKQMKTRELLDKFDNLVADAGYSSEYNYSMLEDKYEDKKYFIPYTLYEKEQTK